MNLIEKFVKTSAIYLFGKIATYIVSFLMLRYYTSNIVPAEYGQYEYIISIVDVVVPVLFIELWSGILRFGMEGDYGKKTEVISTAVFMLIPATLLYVLLYVIIIVIFSMKLYVPPIFSSKTVMVSLSPLQYLSLFFHCFYTIFNTIHHYILRFLQTYSLLF